MELPAKRPEPAKTPEPAPASGAPATYAASAVRKNLAVRVSIRSVAADGEELREHGYGHGV